MYKLYLLICLTFAISNASYAATDDSRISINALVADETIPSEAVGILENKLVMALTANGFADNGYAERIVLTAKTDVVSKDIVPSTPAKVSQKVAVTFIVGDIVENKVYAAYTTTATGIGNNDMKAFVSAFTKISPRQAGLQDMLAEAKTKIIDYYKTNSDAIIINAQALAAMQKYDEAIFRLMSVPNIYNKSYKDCQSAAVAIYQQKMNDEAEKLLVKAKNIWASSPNDTGAQQVAGIISKINPKADNYQSVETFRKQVEDKLQDDAKREWDFQMKQYEDNQAFKRNIVSACRDIGVAYGKNQPRNVIRTIINGWW